VPANFFSVTANFSWLTKIFLSQQQTHRGQQQASFGNTELPRATQNFLRQQRCSFGDKELLRATSNFLPMPANFPSVAFLRWLSFGCSKLRLAAATSFVDTKWNAKVSKS